MCRMCAELERLLLLKKIIRRKDYFQKKLKTKSTGFPWFPSRRWKMKRQRSEVRGRDLSEVPGLPCGDVEHPEAPVRVHHHHGGRPTSGCNVMVSHVTTGLVEDLKSLAGQLTAGAARCPVSIWRKCSYGT